VPQLLGSVAVLVSQPLAALPSQLAKPALQLATVQAPAMQAAVPLGAEQTVPQAPQLFRSVCSFTQTPLQRVKPDWHAVGVHAPAVHACPLGQAVPQVPQLLGSVCSLTQTPLHSVWPALQPPPAPQAPAVQGCPLAQAVPHVPQFDGSVVGSVQPPAHDVPAQARVSPAWPILYSTMRLASAPTFEAQVEPVRNDACSLAPAAYGTWIPPVSIQVCPDGTTRSWPVVPSVKRNTAAGQFAPIGVFKVTPIRSTVMA